MKSKKIISMVLTIVMLAANCFTTSVVFADDISAISSDAVTEAIINDADGDVEGDLCEVYGVNAEDGEGVIHVAITTENLVKHTNGNGVEGYWTGFAVEAPEGAAYAMGLFGEDEFTEPVRDIDGNGTLGIALYVNAGSATPKTEATIQWFNDADEPITSATNFAIDISDVTLAIEYNPMVTAARVVDNTNTERVIYSDYVVTPSTREDGSIVVDIDMTELKEHKNGENEDGYWTGFAIIAPDDATGAKVTFGDEDYGVVTVETIDEEGTEGIAFYANLADAEPKTTATVQWFNGTEAISNVVSFELDLSDVALNWIKADTVTEAIINDADGDVEGDLCETYGVNAEDGEGVIHVAITTENLVKHTNGNGAEGYWTGFAVAAPEGATKADITFGETDYDDEEKVAINEDSTLEGVALYINAGSATPKTEATIQWFNDADEPITAATDFVIDISDVTLAIDYTPTVTEARVVDQTNVAVVPYSTYDVDYSAETGIVDIDMTELKEHKNANDEDGYWTGFAVVAPDDTTGAKVTFGGEDYGIVAVETIDEEGTEGIAFYANLADAEPKTTAIVQWFNGTEAISNAVSFEMDLSDVALNWIKADDVTNTVINDNDGDVTELCSENTVTVETENGAITVYINTKDLKKHTNGNGVEGYWTGFAVEAPEGAAYATGFFGEDSFNASVEDIDRNGTMGIALYVNAGSATPKSTATIRWFNATDEPITAATDFVIDISGVTLAFDNDYTPEIVKANIVNQENVSVIPYSSYNVSSTEQNNEFVVVISMKNLKSHQNGNGVDGHWTGFAVVAPEGATDAKVTFGGEDYGMVDIETIDAEGTEGIAFYTNKKAAEPKTEASIQWFKDGEAISNVISLRMDLSKVKVYSPGGGFGGTVSNNNKEENKTEDKTEDKSDDNIEDNKDETSGITETKVPFNDVKTSDWFNKAVKFVYEKGITNGVSETEFAPNGKVTRGQFITMLCRAYGIKEMTGDNFADSGNTWYTGYLAAAKQLGISNGVGDNKFAPEREITREEMVTLIYNYLKLTGEISDEAAETSFADNAQISDWAKAGVAFASSNGYVKGKGNNVFDPKGYATRAELAQIFFNMFAE